MFRYDNHFKIIEIIMLMIICNIIFSNAFYVSAINNNLPTSTSLQSNTNTKSLTQQIYSSFDNDRNINQFNIKSKIIKKLPKIKNIIDRISYQWVDPLMIKGNSNKTLELEDLWLLEESKQMNASSLKFQTAFNHEKNILLNHNNSIVQTTNRYNNLLLEFWRSPLTKAIVKIYSKQFLYSGILKFFNTMVQFLPSLVIARLLKYIQSNTFNLIDSLRILNYNHQPSTNILAFSSFNMNNVIEFIKVFYQLIIKNHGFQLSMSLFGILCLKTTIENQYFDTVTQLSAEIRGTISTAIYQKALKLSPNSRRNNSIGEITNYMQIDTARMEYAAGTIHTVWDGVLQIIGYTALLLHFLGPSVFAGIAVILIVLPLNAYFLNKLSTLREVSSKLTDKRVKLTNEILQGISMIKSYNWEYPFILQLQKLREEELRYLKKAANVRAILVSTLNSAPAFVAVCSLSLYALLGNELNPTKVFTSLALFNQLRFPLIFLPMLINTLTEGKISLNRLTNFLLTEELQNYVQDISIPMSNNLNNIHSNKIYSNSNVESNTNTKDKLQLQNNKDIDIYIHNASFSWFTSKNQPSNSNNKIKKSIPIIESNSSTSSNSNSSNNNNNIVDCLVVDSKGGLVIRKKELVAIIGPTGSGKSTLLNAILGELNLLTGDVCTNGAIAYVPQNAWIPNDNLRNVILFGNQYNQSKYQQTIHSCGLTRDLELLDSGDLTEIGERGINLSGGQKQRVSIARAVYEDADIYLFDDPLSALDKRVGNQLFNDCIKDLLVDKTRILVTHQLDVLSQVDRIIIMDNSPGIPVVQEGSSIQSNVISSTVCKILDQGTLSELISRGHDLTKYIKKPDSTDTPDSTDSADSSQSNQIIEAKPIAMKLPINNKESNIDNSTIISTIPQHQEGKIITEGSANDITISNTDATKALSIPATSPVLPASKLLPIAAKHQLMTKEEKGEGSVGWHVYEGYIKATNNPILLLAMIIAFILSNASTILQQWAVAAWTSDIGYTKRSLGIYLAGVSFMASCVGIFTYLRTYLQVLLGAAASKTIHKNMIARVLNAPLSYFESTPVGRLLQRFSKDLDNIDQQLPTSIGQLLASSLSIFSSMIAITLVTPSFSLFMIMICSVYCKVTNYYRTVARDLKRLEAISRSPIYSHVSETLGGQSVIRSFHRQSYYTRINEVQLDDNISTYNSVKFVDRWLSVRLEFLGNIIVLFSSILAVYSGSSPGSTGLSLNNALGITGLLNWAVRNAVETEAYMNSIERVNYIINDTPQENAYEIKQFDNSSIILSPSQIAPISSQLSMDKALFLKKNNNNLMDESPSLSSIMSMIKEDDVSDEHINLDCIPSCLDESIIASSTHTSTATATILKTTTETSLASHHSFESNIIAAPKPDVNTQTLINNNITSISSSLLFNYPQSDEELRHSGWPWNGGIVFDNVHLRYRDDFSYVLKGINISIAPGERIGIVGRTGSGKSSIFRGLLRLSEIDTGYITIDGIDISKIGLNLLRSSISIIPQDPILFSGTIRSNLDPFETYTDAQLWLALKKSKLDQLIHNLPGGLLYEVTEGGENFSNGQRQLLCLSRALVRQSSILLLDEATSSVDYETDELIQQTIRNEFITSKTTILTIAHRLNTIMDADKVIVLDNGSIQEYDTPKNLLANSSTIFYKLVNNI